jgi:hypothetical protein
MTDAGDRDPALQELLDKQELRELVQRYNRAADRRDVELMRSVFHPGATYDQGGGPMPGDDIGQQIIDGLNAMMTSSFHSVAGQAVKIRGDEAVGETYLSGQHVLADGKRLRSQTRYLDRFERRDGEWRISERLIVSEGLDVLPPAEGGFAVDSPSRPDRTDPSYALFDSLD